LWLSGDNFIEEIPVELGQCHSRARAQNERLTIIYHHLLTSLDPLQRSTVIPVSPEYCCAALAVCCFGARCKELQTLYLHHNSFTTLPGSMAQGPEFSHCPGCPGLFSSFAQNVSPK